MKPVIPKAPASLRLAEVVRRQIKFPYYWHAGLPITPLGGHTLALLEGVRP